MTISEVIASVDELKPNAYDDDIKIQWLSELDGQIFQEVVLTHEYNPDMPAEFKGYTPADKNNELLVGQPYSRMYREYIFAMMDYMNGETDRYANSVTMFNAKYKEFTDYYNRTHMPLSRRSVRR